MFNFWGKIVFIALKRTMEDGGALWYKTAGITLLLMESVYILTSEMV